MSDENKPFHQTLRPRSIYSPGGGKLTMELSPEAIDILNQLLNKTTDSLDDIFRKSLALYKTAVDAHQEGKAVGAAASADALETEFVGF